MTQQPATRLTQLERRRATALAASARPLVELEVPHIAEFVLSQAYMGDRLYPRQLLLLKLMFCAEHLLTDYDREVLAEWSAGFEPVTRSDGTVAFAGSYGVQPDVVERMRWCREHGRGWMQEVVAVIGRRGSKGHLGALAAAYILWHLLATGDPQKHFGLPAGKQLQVFVFAGKHNQAKANQFADIANALERAPCFAPYLARRGPDTFLLFSPAQVAAGVSDPSRAAILIRAAESTPLSGRGPAAPLQLFDEMAHMTAAGSNRSAEEMYSAAVPASAQFGASAFIYQASSPWQQHGQFFHNYQRGLALDGDTGSPVDPDVLVVQLPSWDLYRDWDRTRGQGLPAWPDGPLLPVQTASLFDEETVGAAQRRADPVNFDVEYCALWATSVAAYLRPADVDAIFAPWQGQHLTMRGSGMMRHDYVAHGDPSRVNANFAFVIAHPEVEPATGQRHVVVDLIRVWRPSDYPNHTINYRQVTRDITDLLIAFPLQSFTLDQFNSAGLLDELAHFARTDPRLLRRPHVSVRHATAPSNLATAESFKTAVLRGLVHAPQHELAESELRNLEERNGRVDHPSRGPVQTSDIADCLMAVTRELLGDGAGHNTIQDLTDFGLTGSHPPESWLSGNHPIGQQLAALSSSQRRQERHMPARGRRLPGSRY